MRGTFADLSGQRFGRLAVLKREPNKGRRVMWLCQCDCGAHIITRADNLTEGGSKSCGCLTKEVNGKRLTVHGKCGTPEYVIYQGMVGRCERPTHGGFEDYGARGIVVCPEWRASFEQFYSDMGPRPSPTHSINRIDNDGPYAPWNCEWATSKQQAANQRLRKRGNRILTFRGETNSVAKLARKYGLRPDTVIHRLNSNWTVEQALTVPLKRTARFVAIGFIIGIGL